MLTALKYAFAVLVWPGLVGAGALGLLYLWIARKLMARLQGRKGPPFYQPFFDLIKLVGKDTVIPKGVSPTLFYALPFFSLASTVLGLVIVPVPGSGAASFPGDLVLLLYLLEVPVLCDVMAGYVSRSIYGQVSAMREAVMSLGYNLPFLAAAIAMAQSAGSFHIGALQSAAFGPVTAFAAMAFLLALPARLKSNPFSIPNAEHEIVGGAHIEYNGVPLAIFELAHALEIVLLFDVFYVLFVPRLGNPMAETAIYLGVSFALIALATMTAALTARFTVKSALRFYWFWGGLAAAAAMVIAVVG